MAAQSPSLDCVSGLSNCGAILSHSGPSEECGHVAKGNVSWNVSVASLRQYELDLQTPHSSFHGLVQLSVVTRGSERGELLGSVSW